MQYLGITDVIWRGQILPCEKGSKIRLGGMRNNAVMLSRSTGRAQEFQGSKVTATVPLAKGQSAKALFAPDEGELQVICDTGQTYVISDAFLSGDIPDITGGEGGKIELTWEGGEAQEIIG